MNVFDQLKRHIAFWAVSILVVLSANLIFTVRILRAVKPTPVQVAMKDFQYVDSVLKSMKAKLKMPTKVVSRLAPELIQQESGYDRFATGDNGKSHGAAQIQLFTAQRILKNGNLTEADLYDPCVNPFLATIFLDQLFVKYKNAEKVLARYSGGLRTDSAGTKSINHNKYGKPIMKRAGF